MSRAVITLLALLVLAPAAFAKAPAPGAPGAEHTWAPADKHGFGTATSAQQRVVHAAQGGADGDLLPRPGDAEPAVARVRRQRRDARRPGDRPGRARAREAAAAGSTFKQTTRTVALGAREDVDHRPSAPTVLARVRFTSLTGKPLRVFVLADPAPGDDGNDDRGTASAPSSWPVTTPSRRLSRRVRGCADDERLRRQRKRPVDGPAERRRPRRDVRRRAARQRRAGRAHAAHGPRLAPRDDARDRVRRVLRRPRAAAPRLRCSRRSRALPRTTRSRGSSTSQGLRAAAVRRRDPELLKLYDQSLLVLAASEDKRTAAPPSPRRRCRGCGAR